MQLINAYEFFLYCGHSLFERHTSDRATCSFTSSLPSPLDARVAVACAIGPPLLFSTCRFRWSRCLSLAAARRAEVLACGSHKSPTREKGMENHRQQRERKRKSQRHKSVLAGASTRASSCSAHFSTSSICLCFRPSPSSAVITTSHSLSFSFSSSPLCLLAWIELTNIRVGAPCKHERRCDAGFAL